MRKRRYYNTGKYDMIGEDSWTSKSKYASPRIVFINTVEDLNSCIGHFVGIKYKCVICGKIEYIPRFRKENINNISKFLCKQCMHREMSSSHPEWQTKGQEAYTAKTGYDNPMSDPKTLKKIQESYSKNHNGYGMNQSPEDRARIRQQHIDHPEWFHNNKLFYYGIGFDSMWELAIWIYAKDHNEFIIREPFMISLINKPENHVIPDFWYKNGLLEIKGHHLSKIVDGKLTFMNSYNPNDMSGVDKLNTLLAYNCDIYRRSQMYRYLSYVNKIYGTNYLKLFYKSNTNNPSYSATDNKCHYSKPVNIGKGLTPFDLNVNDTIYAKPNGFGVVPYDIMLSKPIEVKSEKSVTYAVDY